MREESGPAGNRKGFTLIEMSLVLIVIGLIILTIFPALNIMRTSNQRALTQSNLDALMRATASFVQANGCLPCPTPINDSLNPNGFGRVRGDSSATPSACGNCSTAEGIPPFLSLGIPPSVAHDGWNHWITMRIDSALANPPTISLPPAAACSDDDLLPNTKYPECKSVGKSEKGLCRANIPGTRINVHIPGTAMTTQAAVIFVSHGSSGLGAFQIQLYKTTGSRTESPNLNCTILKNYAKCNGDGNSEFYDAPYSTDEATAFDQVLAYADRNNLVSYFGNGACQTTW